MSSRSANILKTSDVATSPIKTKYHASYGASDWQDKGIVVYTGINAPIGPSEGYSTEAMIYRSIKHLYYSNYVSGSFPTTASYYDNWLQSTAALGTIEADQRYFPTGPNQTIKVLSIPKSAYGERISRRSFSIKAGNVNLIDDGNGNVLDLSPVPGYFLPLYFNNPDEYFEIVQVFSAQVGNIIYAQGLVIITNQSYQYLF